MKKFLKNNFLVIISFIIVFMLASIGLYKEFREQNNNYKVLEKNLENCKNTEVKTLEEQEYCDNLIKNGVQKEGFFTVFGDLVTFNLNSSFALISGGLLLILCTYEATKLKKKIPYNYLVRENFKDYKKRVLKSGYKYLWLIPSILIYLIIAVSIFTNFNFASDNVIWNGDSVKNVFLFLTCYVCQTMLISGIYINIVLSVTRKYKNFFLALIVSILGVLGAELILEVGIGGILFNNIFHSGVGILFNILDIYFLNDSMGVMAKVGVLLSIYLVSLIPLYLLYKDKEKYVLDCER